MGLSSNYLETHIKTWEQKLTGASYAHRAKWPAHLFHHTPVENAVGIIDQGALLSRNASQGHRARDVAAPGVIDTRDRAHDYVRLYFRPRTPTQYHIEGIRKPGECTFGDASQAPVLTMLVFDARSVLSMLGTRFSDANMQWAQATDGDSEEFFSKIHFHNVYSEGGFTDPMVTKHRCAEVLAPSPLVLEQTLKWIYCRSEAEKAALLHWIGIDAYIRWHKRVIVSDDLRVFEKRFAYVEQVSLSASGVIFQLAPRRDARALDVRVQAWNEQSALVVNFHNDALDARPPNGGSWRVAAKLADGTYRVKISLEGHVAYENLLTLGDVPF